jgi:hypothetical protein
MFCVTSGLTSSIVAVCLLACLLAWSAADGTLESTKASLKLGLQPDSYAGRVRQLKQEWLQKLAVRLQPVQQAPHTPNYIDMNELKLELPLSSLVRQHYGGMMNFVAATPEVRWTEPPRNNQMWYLCIVPEWHERLLKAAEIAGRGHGAAGAGTAARRSSQRGPTPLR